MAGYKNKLDGTLSAFDAAYPGQGKALAAILDDTPQLKARFNQAAEAGQLTIDKVAGPVGEALVMTAVGLAVAIPAVLGYNLLGRRIGQIEAELEGFAHDLQAQFGER